ncbi:MAG: phospholipid carrier-dependent glycosyltransferase, partial [Clostridiales bacterium]|nr:phospholipid carrier-dependent glycosyltransferase [Clostridiales bacterium]
MIYTLVLYLVFFALTYSYFNIEEKKSNGRNAGMYVILTFALAFRLFIFLSVTGHTTDVACFKAWAQRLAQVGTHGFYAEGYFADYPPGYIIVLYLIGVTARFFGLADASAAFTALIKLPSILADIALGYVVYRAAAARQTKKSAAVLTMLLLFNPAVFVNSALWGQIDAFFTLFMVLSLLCVYFGQAARREGEPSASRRAVKFYCLGAVLYTVCALVKPQAFLIAPVYLCAYIETRDWKMIAKSALLSLVTVLLTALPFTRGWNFLWLIEKYRATLTSYPYASINAYNLYALLGYNWRDVSTRLMMLPVAVWANLTILAVTAGSVWFYIKSRNRAKIFYMAYLMIAVMFTLGARMHERYLFPAIFLLALTYIFHKDNRLLFLMIAQSTAHYLNVGDVLAVDVSGSGTIHAAAVTVAALLHIASLLYSLYLAKEVFLPRKARATSAVPDDGAGNPRPVRADYLIMAALTLVYGVIAFVRLGDATAPQTFYHTERGGAATLDLGESREVSSVLLYLGIGDGGYTIEISNDGAAWDAYASPAHDTVFAWRRAGESAWARYLKITADTPGLMLGEVGVIGKEGEPLTVSSTDVALTDEQHAVPQRPTYRNGSYFDEVYHPRTAYEILHALPPYEVTHPPLGKLIIAAGVMTFGMTPFGWRFMGTVAGILMVPLFYLLCKKLVKRTDFAAAGTVLFTFDFMHFAQTRIGTVDSFAVLLIMAMYYFIIDYFNMDFNKEPLKKGLLPLALCGVCFGAGAAVKWICLYAALGLAVLIFTVWLRAFARRKAYADYTRKLLKSVAWCVLFFVIVPSLIYFASYLPQTRYALRGETPLEYAARNQNYMLNYHKGVKDDHPYSSDWYEWPADQRPLWAYMDGELREAGAVSSISSFGNPIVWWGGLLAVIWCGVIGIAKKNRACAVIVIGYLSQFVPWIFVPRILFIYHYFASVPFIALAAAYAFRDLYARGRIGKRFVCGYCAAAVLLFVMFYPVI